MSIQTLSEALASLTNHEDHEDQSVRRHTNMTTLSPKCALELSPEISTGTIADWWKLIHAGWAHPLNYLHGGAICSPRECYEELKFLHQIGTIIHEETTHKGYAK